MAASGDPRRASGYALGMTDPAYRPPTQSDPTSQASGTAPVAAKKRSFSVGQLLAAILFVLVVIFIVENTDNVKIRIIAGPKVNAPVFVALLIAAVAGALISELLRFRRKHHQRR